MEKRLEVIFVSVHTAVVKFLKMGRVICKGTEEEVVSWWRPNLSKS